MLIRAWSTAVQQAARRGIEAAITAALNAYGLPAALNALNQLPAALDARNQLKADVPAAVDARNQLNADIASLTAKVDNNFKRIINARSTWQCYFPKSRMLILCSG